MTRFNGKRHLCPSACFAVLTPGQQQVVSSVARSAYCHLLIVSCRVQRGIFTPMFSSMASYIVYRCLILFDMTSSGDTGRAKRMLEAQSACHAARSAYSHCVMPRVLSVVSGSATRHLYANVFQHGFPHSLQMSHFIRHDTKC